MEGRMGVARLGSLSVDDMALARDRERQSPRVCIANHVCLADGAKIET